MATVSLAASLGLPPHTAAVTTSPKVAIIVGPVGSLTPTYLHFAELAATAATQGGATVARAYSPNATPANVLAAVADANVVIYFGHGYGHPSPYGGLDAGRQNGWGLQGPRARGTHGDSLGGELAYYGEDWIIANARPAPGFVMIYSNTCYAPGASEGGHAPATESVALQRVAHYSRKVFAMGGSAYYAIDFDRGAADLVGSLLADPRRPYGATFASDHRYVPSALRTFVHPLSAGQQVWLHRSKYTKGAPNYWYAFAGNPDAVPARSWDPTAPSVQLTTDVSGVSPSAPITVRVSEPVVGLDATSVELVDPAGSVVEAEVGYDAATGVATVRPKHDLALSTTYVVRLAAGIADLAGNALPATAWRVTTRIDADPLERDVPIVLEPGTHDLARIDHHGTVVERRAVEVTDDRWLTATRRARLPGHDGSYFEIGVTDLAGWWVQESPSAHATGALDAAVIDSGQVTLPPGDYRLHDIADGMVTNVSSLTVRPDRTLAVDRRLIVDGQLYLRLAEGEAAHAARWLRVTGTEAPPDSRTQRILADESRDPWTLSLGIGEWPIFRFDADGRVVDRRTVSGTDVVDATTTRTLDVGGARFFVLRGGELDGWAVREAPRVAVTPVPRAAEEHD
jgi:hypothetical protein